MNAFTAMVQNVLETEKKNTQFACNCRDLTTVYKFIKNCLYSRIIPSPVNCFVVNLLLVIVAVLLLAGIVF